MSTSTPSKSRVIIVSNRLPITITVKSNGEDGNASIDFKASSGGLVSGLREVHAGENSIWIGHCGIFEEDGLFATVQEPLRSQRYEAVRISKDTYDAYYNCFSNGAIWPLFHYFPEKVRFSRGDWQKYQEANESFAQTILSIARPNDQIWIHDYHLMPLPRLLRNAMPTLRISYFHHIPFPSSELFRILPEGKQLLKGLLGADLIGFHTLDYTRHFITAVTRLLGLESDRDNIHVSDKSGGTRSIKVGAFPLGVDVEYIYKSAEKFTLAESGMELLEVVEGKKVLLGIDRLDYTKGLPQRLLAFQQMLRLHPEHVGNVVFLQICVPSREGVTDYQELKADVDRLVGEINGEFGRPGYVPLHYLYKPFSADEVFSFYHLGDVAVVTPLRDGLNLVCKEFVASKTNNRGSLILSEFAGAAAEMGEALLVNPFDLDDIAENMHQALTLSPVEQERRMTAMRNRITSYNNLEWSRDFVSVWQEITERQTFMGKVPKFIDNASRENILETIANANFFPLFLDYDGTLTPIVSRPELAIPSPRLLSLLNMIGQCEKFELTVITGRPRHFCDLYFGDIPINIVAEHGALIRRKGKNEWQAFLPAPDIAAAKEVFLPELERFTRRIPGSFIEHKESSVVLHYRQAEAVFARLQALELKEALNQLLAGTSYTAIKGKKVIEIRPIQVDKRRALERLLAEFHHGGSFLTAGDDKADEDMFNVSPDRNISVHVGAESNSASFSVASSTDLLDILELLVSRVGESVESEMGVEFGLADEEVVSEREGSSVEIPGYLH